MKAINHFKIPDDTSDDISARRRAASCKVKTPLRLLAAELAVLLLGPVLLIAVRMIPAERIAPRAVESSRLNSAEMRPELLPQVEASSLDNYTDSLMLNVCLTESGDPIQDMLLAPFTAYGGDNAVEDFRLLCEGAEGGVQTAYLRYWHGWQLFVRPLLLFANISTIRYLQMLLMLVLTVLLLLRLHEARGWALSLPFLAFWLSLYPPGLFFSLQYGAIYCVTVLGCLGVLRAGEERRILLFEMIGAAASYFDLMTYPLVSLGVPLALWMCLSAGEEKQLINRTGQALGLCLCWGFGYTFTWVFKWLLAGLLTGSDAIAESLSVAAFRISGQMGPEHIGPLSAIIRNISVFAYKGLLLGLLLLFAAMLWLLRRRGRQSRCMSDTLGLLGCALMPFIWYALLSNHSHIHAFFTYRELSITVFALFALLMLPLKGQLPPGNNQSIAK